MTLEEQIVSEPFLLCKPISDTTDHQLNEGYLEITTKFSNPLHQFSESDTEGVYFVQQDSKLEQSHWHFLVHVSIVASSFYQRDYQPTDELVTLIFLPTNQVNTSSSIYFTFINNSFDHIKIKRILIKEILPWDPRQRVCNYILPTRIVM